MRLNTALFGAFTAVVTALSCFALHTFNPNSWTPFPAATANAGAEGALKGLPGVMVEIANLTEEAKRIGLTRDALRQTTEQRLRQSGIRILSLQEWQKTQERPSLLVQAYVDDGCFNVLCELKEDARVMRSVPLVVYGAITWQRATARTHGGVSQPVLAAVWERVNEFSDDWRKANEKR